MPLGDFITARITVLDHDHATPAPETRQEREDVVHFEAESPAIAS